MDGHEGRAGASTNSSSAHIDGSIHLPIAGPAHNPLRTNNNKSSSSSTEARPFSVQSAFTPRVLRFIPGCCCSSSSSMAKRNTTARQSRNGWCITKRFITFIKTSWMPNVYSVAIFVYRLLLLLPVPKSHLQPSSDGHKNSQSVQRRVGEMMGE